MTDKISPANRELDELVAEKVMGLIPCDQWTEFGLGSAGGDVLRKNCAHENCYSTREIHSVHGTIGGCPPYSTKIHAAWEVVRRLQARGYAFQLEANGEEWSASFPPAEKCSSDSAERAICLAALKTLESQETKKPDEMTSPDFSRLFPTSIPAQLRR